MAIDTAPAVTGTQLGYARVSTGHQSLDQQVDALTSAGVDGARVYTDKLSGTSTREERPGLAALLDYAREGDAIVVVGIDRLGRNAAEVMTTIRELGERGGTAPACPETPLLGKVGVMSGGSSRRYPPELRERAVRMVAEISDQHDSEWAAISEVARLLGVGTAETVRKWVRQAQIDAGSRAGTTSEESAELKKLKREVAELRRANAILKTASAFFAAELDRPQH